MNEPLWSAASVPWYRVVEVNVDVLVPFGSITLEPVCVGCDSIMRGAPKTPREVSNLSERMELTETTDDVFERFGETMCSESSPLQETMRVAMK